MLLKTFMLVHRGVKAVNKYSTLSPIRINDLPTGALTSWAQMSWYEYMGSYALNSISENDWEWQRDVMESDWHPNIVNE